MKSTFEKYLESLKTYQAVPDELPLALLLTHVDMEKLNSEPTAGKNTGNIGGLPFVLVPYLKNSVTLFASGKTTRLEL